MNSFERFIGHGPESVEFFDVTTLDENYKIHDKNNNREIATTFVFGLSRVFLFRISQKARMTKPIRSCLSYHFLNVCSFISVDRPSFLSFLNDLRRQK